MTDVEQAVDVVVIGLGPVDRAMHVTNLLITMVVAFLAPLVVSTLPALRVSSPVLEIVAGIVLGPSVLVPAGHLVAVHRGRGADPANGSARYPPRPAQR